MIPVTQTRFYEPELPPDQQRGNCLTAVVASLLELPIEEVPNFVQDHVDHEGDTDWNWWTRMHRFVQEQGHEIAYLRATPDGDVFPDPEPGEFYTVTGVSPRNPEIHHIVIYRDGVMVHDPHPDRTGLAVIDAEHHWTIRRGDGRHPCPTCGHLMDAGGKAFACGPVSVQIDLPPACRRRECQQARDATSIERAIAAGVIAP